MRPGGPLRERLEQAALVLGLALLTSLCAYRLVDALRTPSPDPAIFGLPPQSLESLDGITLLPVEVSAAGAVFAVTALVTFVFVRWASSD